MNEFKIICSDTTKVANDENINAKFNRICNDAILKANEKSNNLEPWLNSASAYLINEFLYDYQSERQGVLNFGVEQKVYNSKYLISENLDLSSISTKYLRNKNTKNAYKHSDGLGKQIFSIIMDYIDFISNESDIETKHLNKNKEVDLEDASVEFEVLDSIPSLFTSRFKNFERDLLMQEYESKKEDIDNKGMRGLIYGTSRLFYASSNERFFVISYSPANEQYYNPKIKEVNKAPNFSFFVYSKEVEDFFIENYEIINNLHRNFMQFTYLSDTNQNVVNAMGETALISQYWYTESVNRILKDHDKELKKAQDSQLLAEYIIRYILAAEIKGVNLIEVYPFDRVFMFNNSIFEPNKDDTTFTVFEGLLESKVPHENIENKNFLGGKTQYAYEWEREKTGFELDRFDPSKKKIKKILTNATNFVKDEQIWENDYNKDDETVINNLIVSMLKGDKEYNRTQMLEYKSKYSNDGITYFYSSGTNLQTQIGSLYNLQKHHFNNMLEDDDDGVTKGVADILLGEDYKTYFNNVKVILFSYTPEDELSQKGFTLIMIANDDVTKSLMEQKSEKDDLHTALKLLVNQHFTIDQKYKEQSIKEQRELIDILTQTKHSIKNSFENFQDGDSIEQLKKKVLGIIEQDRMQMLEQGQDATIKEFIRDKGESETLQNSLHFIQSMFTSTEMMKDKHKTLLSKKFDAMSQNAWDFFATSIYTLDISMLSNNRIHEVIWKENNNPQTQLKLIIDFNELQNFSVDWKESLFNDAIYVMLKNACEHSIETYKSKDKKREIFLDVYISHTDGKELLNVEFTNKTGKICKEIFTHINEEIIVKNNHNKENSTGIGVVTIRKRLDVTYGLDSANIKFTMVSANTIKSLLYFPIKSLEDNTLFANSNDCVKKESSILYLEDSSEYYEQNISLLKSKELSCNHDIRYREGHDYARFKILITDLNIFSENEDIAISSNGEDAISDFIEKNPTGVILVLSSDIDNLDMETVNYTKVILNDNAKELKSSHIYLSSKKVLNKKVLELIKLYEINTISPTVNLDKPITNTSQKQTVKQTTVFTPSSILPMDTINIENNQDILLHGDINSKIFISENTQNDIEKWLRYKVKVKNKEYSLSNCEVTHRFSSKLIVGVKKSYADNFVLRHEGNIRNIIFVENNILKNNTKIIDIVNYSFVGNLHKKGIFGKISHDILNKMPEFSIYNSQKIADLKIINDHLRQNFSLSFDSFVDLGKLQNQNELQKEFEEFVTEIEQLKNIAVSRNTHLGTNIENIDSIITILKYIKGE